MLARIGILFCISCSSSDESVKAAADIYSPVDGEISAVNSELETSPEIINHSSFDNGWLFKIKLSDKSQLETLLDKQEYEDLN